MGCVGIRRCVARRAWGEAVRVWHAECVRDTACPCDSACVRGGARVGEKPRSRSTSPPSIHPPGIEAPSPPVSAHRRGRELPGRKHAAVPRGRDPTPFPSRAALCPSPPCLLCAAGTGIFHLPAPAGPDLRSGARSRLCPRGAPGASPGPGPGPAEGKGDGGDGGGRDGAGGCGPWRPALAGEPCQRCPASARPSAPAQVCAFPALARSLLRGQRIPLKWGARLKGCRGRGRLLHPAVGVRARPPASHVSVKASSPAGGSARPRPLPDTRGDAPGERESGRVGPGRAGRALPGGGVAAAPRGRTGSPPAAL